MSAFPSETTDPRKLRWLPAHLALRQLRAATGLTFSRSTFYRWLQDGTIPARKLVSSWHVAAQDVAHLAKETFQP